MDAESLKSLGWLLFWGVLIFVMLRYGCGAHVMGGHGGHGGHGESGETPAGQAKDPVCGMNVDPKNAAAASVHGGTTYYFCSASCRDQFERDPKKFAAAGSRAGHQHGGSCHG